MAAVPTDPYNMLGPETDAQQAATAEDPDVSSFAKLIGQKFGGGDDAVDALKAILSILQAAFGMQNKGVVMAESIRGGLMNFGAPGIMPGGQLGVINGRDVASYYASEAVKRELVSEFTNPVTGRTNALAHGLNVAELGKAAKLAFESGEQFKGGPMFESETVTKDSLLKMQQSKDPAVREEAKTLQEGSIRQRVTPDGKRQAVKMFEEYASTLGSIKEVLGSKALDDVENTMNELFGGSIQKYGVKAARMRMLQIKALGETSFGGGVAGSTAAAAALAASADAGLAVWAPELSPEAARQQFGTLVSHGAIYAQRMAAAAGAAGALNQAEASKGGFFTRTPTPSDVARTEPQVIATIQKQEPELVAAQFSLQKRGNAATAEQKSELRGLEEAFVSAGGDEKKLATARLGLSAFVSKISGGQSVGTVIARAGGIERTYQQLSAENAERNANVVSRNSTARYEDLQYDQFASDTNYNTKEFGNLDKNTAGLLGRSITSLSATTTGELADIVDRTADPSTREMQLRDYFDNHKSAKEALSGSMRGSPEEQKAQMDQFYSALANKGSGLLVRKMKTDQNSTEDLRTFVSREDVMAETKKNHAAYWKTKQQNATATTGDAMDEFMKGLTGQHDWTDDEVIRAVEDNSHKKTKGSAKSDDELITDLELGEQKNPETKGAVWSFKTDKDNKLMLGEDEDLDLVRLQTAVGEAGAKKIGLPNTAGEAKKWLESADNQAALGAAMGNSGIVSQQVGVRKWAALGTDAANAQGLPKSLSDLRKQQAEGAPKSEHPELEGLVKTFKTDKEDNLILGEGDEGGKDLKNLREAIGEDTAAKIGLPNTAEEAKKWLESTDNQNAVDVAMAGTGVTSEKNGIRKWLSHKDKNAMTQNLDMQAAKNTYKNITGEEFTGELKDIVNADGSVDPTKLPDAYKEGVQKNMTPEKLDKLDREALWDSSGDISIDKDGKVVNKSKGNANKERLFGSVVPLLTDEQKKDLAATEESRLRDDSDRDGQLRTELANLDRAHADPHTENYRKKKEEHLRLSARMEGTEKHLALLGGSSNAMKTVVMHNVRMMNVSPTPIPSR